MIPTRAKLKDVAELELLDIDYTRGRGAVCGRIQSMGVKLGSQWLFARFTSLDNPKSLTCPIGEGWTGQPGL